MLARVDFPEQVLQFFCFSVTGALSPLLSLDVSSTPRTAISEAKMLPSTTQTHTYSPCFCLSLKVMDDTAPQRSPPPSPSCPNTSTQFPLLRLTVPLPPPISFNHLPRIHPLPPRLHSHPSIQCYESNNVLEYTASKATLPLSASGCSIPSSQGYRWH